ncbi:tRNA (adenosine(37)-N6)-threonylcarbamoyltransferase complex dimerization subunit type 1 TsaB [Nesterenkonia ebinurensis]|uniref:tRNA (adenosine(37)-N6)-threonylcarbamoyltransferase complex dimerization subunit type 1 TsaB n=1 Tax=Nesterenkonia ebinurensis TaxID=2608252 RepID=UPI00123CB483|nr:tRNA (adenosine(37)-N6)-threonylcarbamoyltransferase complex dimerization subunit type 1 TsaB [Nesterenkonia ebinurensis]
MLLLAIDSSAGASLALIRSGNVPDAAPEVLHSAETQVPNAHAEWLAPAVTEALTEVGLRGEELDGVVVGAGPGPFTGLRVGLALAHGLAEGWDVPLHGVCSLDSLALRADDAGISGQFLATSDARRRELYWARYESAEWAPEVWSPGKSSEFSGPPQAGCRLVEGPFVGPAEELPDLPSVGAGLWLYPDQLTSAELAGAPADPAAWTPHAVELGRLAHGALTGELHGVLCAPRPLYLRDSDAKVPAQMKGRAG